MNKLAILLMPFLFQNFALAGSTECRPDVQLICSLKFSLVDGGVLQGPIKAETVVDIQPEPFDASGCEAAVVFKTDLGKFVAVYSDETHTLRSWINTGKSEQLLLNDVEISPTKSATASYESVNLTCSL